MRAGQTVPKQFAEWRGKPLVRHSVEALASHGASRIVVAIPEGMKNVADEALRGIPGVEFVTGRKTRQGSVAAALDHLAVSPPEIVLIHDAARPVIGQGVIDRLVAALETSEGAIPTLPVVDSLVQAEGDRMTGKAERDVLRRVQTPQAFRFDRILLAHRAWRGEPDSGDDAQVLVANGGTVALVDGDEIMKKMTFAGDFATALPPVRIGTGFDVHRLADGEELWLGGVRIDHERGLCGHSDADVALHAIVDALLGAIGAEDIGSHFPPSDPEWRGAPSSAFLTHAAKLVDHAGYRTGNVDLTIICEAPKIGPHREAMRKKIADLLCIETTQVSVKATTTERLGFTGRGEGIAAQAAATVIRNETGA